MSAVVYGMLANEKSEETHEVAVYTHKWGNILVPNDEDAVVGEDPHSPTSLTLGRNDHWDKQLNSYCEEKGITPSKIGWWLVATS